MFLKNMRAPKFFSIMAFAIGMCAESANAGWQDYVEESTSVIVKKLPKFPENARKETLIEIFSQPKVTMFDLSISDVKDDDLKNIVLGLATRAQSTNHLPLKILDISSQYITKSGVEWLLESFESGITDEKNNPANLSSDVKNIIIKVPFNVSNKLHARWCEKAPTVFSNGLTLLQ